MAEMMDIYDEACRPTGRTFARGTKLAAGDYFLVVHVCVFHPDGRLLIQRRQTCKKSWPGLWDVSVGGGVLAGETSRQAAMREAREELGLALNLSRARPAMTVNFEGGFDDFYTVERALDPAALLLQPEEVAAAKWADRDEVTALLQAGEFLPFYPGFLDLLFQRGAKDGFLTE